MKNKGFTLIELLAVIVILAIIAAIAIPTVLNIIDNTKNSSNEISMKSYVSAVNNAIKSYEVQNKKQPTTFSDIKNYIEYKGSDVSCNISKIYNDGTFYLGGCVVNGSSEKYVYDKEVYVLSTPVSFTDDDWLTIVENVKAGILSAYRVGDTKEITLTGEVAGTYTVRIANTSTPEECNTEGFSQTACGFVIEFEDIITERGMNSTDTNVGGWRDSEMRIYVNNTIYNAFPTELKENIKETIVVSGHGSTSGETNFVTTDRLYLLSTKEVWGKEGNSNLIEYETTDTAEEETRQLDYYKNQNVSTSNYSGAIKNYNESSVYYWLRSANSNFGSTFFRVNADGDWDYNVASYDFGVAVAFRIG